MEARNNKTLGFGAEMAKSPIAVLSLDPRPFGAAVASTLELGLD
jgi:hypothetical protein